jgi:predicted 3-demethylubiquinone-9 3-methyltransferase (glyoxalase superfamily)
MAQQKITPHLWFSHEAKEAAAFYTQLFPHSQITNVTTLRDTPTGDCDLVSFVLDGYGFAAINASPVFTFTPAISFFISCTSEAEADHYWKALSEGGKVMMPLDEYFFSKKYGWVADKYGLSWQVILEEGDLQQRIVPSLLFVDEMYDKAEEALNFYVDTFRNAKVNSMYRYGPDQQPDKEGAIMYADFILENQLFAAMESAHEHHFAFNEAISFVVNCDDQDEIDYYWDRLSAQPEAEQCGWVKDRFGLSWQVVPREVQEMIVDGSPEQVDRVTQSFLTMKKFNLDELRNAFRG